MIDRRAFILATAGLLAAPLAAEGQQAGKVYNIDVLEIVDEASNASNLSAFRQGLFFYPSTAVASASAPAPGPATPPLPAA